MTFRQAEVSLDSFRRIAWFPSKGLRVGAILGGWTILTVYMTPELKRCWKCGTLCERGTLICHCGENPWKAKRGKA